MPPRHLLSLLLLRSGGSKRGSNVRIHVCSLLLRTDRGLGLASRTLRENLDFVTKGEPK
jgi:hypothetical protein